MHRHPTHQKRMKWLLFVAAWATFALGSKILASILAQYAHYFPPDFSTEFLLGRQSYFFGSYALAFYTHALHQSHRTDFGSLVDVDRSSTREKDLASAIGKNARHPDRRLRCALGFGHVHPRDRWADSRNRVRLFFDRAIRFDAGGDQRGKKEKFRPA